MLYSLPFLLYAIQTPPHYITLPQVPLQSLLKVRGLKGLIKLSARILPFHICPHSGAQGNEEKFQPREQLFLEIRGLEIQPPPYGPMTTFIPWLGKQRYPTRVAQNISANKSQAVFLFLFFNSDMKSKIVTIYWTHATYICQSIWKTGKDKRVLFVKGY